MTHPYAPLFGGLSCAQELTSDEHFWQVNLRVGLYGPWSRRVQDPAWRLLKVATLYRSKEAAADLMLALGGSPVGTAMELHRRIADHGPAVLPWLLLAQFGQRRSADAVEELARAVLPPRWLDALGRRRGANARLAALLLIARHRPATLPWLRALHLWHSRAMVAMALTSRPAAPPSSPGAGLAEMLQRASWVDRALAALVGGEDQTPPRFEMAVPGPDGSTLLLLRRGHQRAHVWEDDADHLHHGLEEDLLALRVAADGRRVGVVGDAVELGRRAAGALASAWFGEELAFAHVVETAPLAGVGRMLTALLAGAVPGLSLIELGVRNTPLPGAPELVLRAVRGDLADAVRELAALGRPIATSVDDVLFLRVRYADRVALLDLVRGGDDRVVVRFADARADPSDAAGLRQVLESAFGLRLHPMEARVA